MTQVLKGLTQVLANGYLLFFYSERLFWARWRPDDSPVDWLWTWLAYSVLAYFFLALTAYFRVRTAPALFLAGAAFGWLGEGVLVQTTYESLPLSISFTGLAWHALLSVMVGWYAFRSALRDEQSGWRVARLACLIGLGYGLWAIGWWLQPDGGVATLAEFAGYSLASALPALPAYWLANWSADERLVRNRTLTSVLAVLALAYFALVAVPAAPVAAAILPLLAVVLWVGLRRNREVEPDGATLVHSLSGRVPARRYASVLLIPAVAVLVYATAQALGLAWHTAWVGYLVTTPLGFGALGLSLWRILRTVRPTPGSDPTP